MVLVLLRVPNVLLCKCQTNTCHPTRFSSSKTCPRTSARINSWLCSHSTWFLSSLLHRNTLLLLSFGCNLLMLIGILFTDIQTCTKCVLSQRRRILLSSSIWTREVQLWPRTRCITTSSTERTKSRYVCFWVYIDPCLWTNGYFCRLRSQESNRITCFFSDTWFALYCISNSFLLMHLCCTSTTRVLGGGSFSSLTRTSGCSLR